MKMKSMITLILVSGLGLARAAMAESALGQSNNGPGSNPYSSPYAPTSNTKGEFNGSVWSIDLFNKILEMRDDSGEMRTIQMALGVQIFRDGKLVKLKELQSGDPVAVKTSN